MNRRSPATSVLTGILAVALLAACGSDDDGDEAGNGDVAAESEATDDSAVGDEGAEEEATDDGGAASGAGVVQVSDSSLGEILVDGDGRTLYLFTADSPGESTCTDDCLDAWPVLEGEVDAGEGVDSGLLGTIERDDGSVQATYADWPLYYFAADQAAGDLNGQGVNDVWFVIDSSGNAIEQAAGSDDSEDEPEDEDMDEDMDDESEDDDNSGY